MKLLFISPKYYPTQGGGSERSLKLLVDGLLKKGHDVSVLSFDGKKRIIEESINGAKVIRVKKLSLKPSTLSHNLTLLLFRNIIKKEDPDVIHVYNTWHIPASIFLKGIAPVVATLNNVFPICATAYTRDRIIEKGKTSFLSMFHGLFITFDKSFFKKFFLAAGYSLYSVFIRTLSKRLDYYIAYSKSIKEIYVKNNFEESKIFVINTLFDKKEIEPRNKTGKIVLYVGSATEVKGFFELVRAISILKRKDIEFRLVGITELDQQIEKKILKIDNVKLVRKLPYNELEEHYNQASCLIYPAQIPDMFPRVWIEAITHNLPIISSDQPVALDVLKNAALFYKRGSPKDLAEKIDKFFKNEEVIDIAVAKKDLFSKTPMEDMIKLYNKMIEDGRKN